MLNVPLYFVTARSHGGMVSTLDSEAKVLSSDLALDTYYLTVPWRSSWCIPDKLNPKSDKYLLFKDGKCQFSGCVKHFHWFETASMPGSEKCLSRQRKSAHPRVDGVLE